MHRTVMKAARCCCFVCTRVRVAFINQCPVCVLCAHIRVLVQRAAAAASCSLHHCAMHLCVSRDVTNGLPSYTAIYFDFNWLIVCVFSRGEHVLLALCVMVGRQLVEQRQY